MNQPKQLKRQGGLKLKQLRYRRMTLSGGNTVIINKSPQKVKNHSKILQFPVLNEQQNNKIDPVIFINSKIYEEELYRRNNYRAVKAMVKSFNNKKTRSNSQSMNQLGLDIKKLTFFKQQSKSAITNAQTIGKSKFKSRNFSPKHGLFKLSSRSTFTPKQIENSVNLHDSEDIFALIGNKLDNNNFLFNNSVTLEKHLRELDYENFTIVDRLEEIQSEQLVNWSARQNTAQNQRPAKQTSRQSQSVNSPRKSPNKKPEYLYQKLANKKFRRNEEINQVYERRIKSYTNFLFKLFYAHNIYINLDFTNQELSDKNKRVKCYVGPGNNSAMVRGLLKRRYWWTFTDDMNQANFVWTQTKQNYLFEKQKTSQIPIQVAYKSNNKKSQSDQQISTNFHKTQSYRKTRVTKNQTVKHRIYSPSKSSTHKIANKMEEYNHKIMNAEDVESYSNYIGRCQIDPFNKIPVAYAYKLDKYPKSLRELSIQTAIVHNHFPYNYNLGNKKALFYNLQQYYKLINQNPFEYIPLTFHIKKGFKDPEYNRFIMFYNRRKNIIKKEIKEAEEQYGEGYEPTKKKTRNIWIVKPGENSNQGRGITVIDEIYELNNIIKGIGENKINNQQEKQQKRTYIVQMYIDRPFLYNNRKFDIRHYMLVTNLYGVTRVYWYQEGYIRTSSYQFKIDKFEPEIHLTNDCIQKKYPEYGRYEPCNKLSYEEFQRYIDMFHSNKQYSFKNDILPKMKKMATDAAKSVFLKMSPNNLEHNFQIFGLDFMVDRHFRPWLIEINTNPSLQCNCNLLDRIIPYMVEQSLKLSVDVVYPPPSHYPNTCKFYAPMINLQTFKYELIFDERTDGQQIKKLYGVSQSNQSKRNSHTHMKILNSKDIGELDDNQWFEDDGKQIKLDDFA